MKDPVMFKKLLCLLLACLLLLPAASYAKDETPSTVRVLLRRLYLTDRADLTLTGRYLVRSVGDTELLLPADAKVTVRLEDGRLILFTGGISANMGKSLSLLRQDSGETVPGIRFNLQSGFYPGDLSLSVEDSRIVPILTLPIETYLQGVVPYEMGDGFPEEALKAQAVCARTYALSHLNPKASWDVVDTTNDQVFRGIPDKSPKSAHRGSVSRAFRSSFTKAGDRPVPSRFRVQVRTVASGFSASQGSSTMAKQRSGSCAFRCASRSSDPRGGYGARPPGGGYPRNHTRKTKRKFTKTS